MAKTKVLVVDDSFTMRALIGGMLDKDADIEVVGMADGAAEARQMVRDLKPNVMTLDVEMPGMSGIEYLGELMATNPMPVVMFSTRTEKGAESSIEALRLGAIDCYPKPLKASAADVEATIGKLAVTVKSAPARFAEQQAQRQVKNTGPFAWNGRIVAVGADVASTRSLFDLLGQFPADCPPTVVVQHMRPEFADGIIRKLGDAIQPQVVEATDGLKLQQGMVVVARPGTHHVYIDRWPDGHVRLLDKPPFAGQRPSISLLMATLAQTAAASTVGVLLGAEGEDGVAGGAKLREAKGYMIAPAAGTPGQYEVGKGLASQAIGAGDVAAAVLKLCRA